MKALGFQEARGERLSRSPQPGLRSPHQLISSSAPAGGASPATASPPPVPWRLRQGSLTQVLVQGRQASLGCGGADSGSGPALASRDPASDPGAPPPCPRMTTLPSQPLQGSADNPPRGLILALPAPLSPEKGQSTECCPQGSRDSGGAEATPTPIHRARAPLRHTRSRGSSTCRILPGAPGDSLAVANVGDVPQRRGGGGHLPPPALHPRRGLPCVGPLRQAPGAAGSGVWSTGPTR